MYIKYIYIYIYIYPHKEWTSRKLVNFSKCLESFEECKVILYH